MVSRKIIFFKKELRFNLGKSSLLFFLVVLFISLFSVNQWSFSSENNSISANRQKHNINFSFSNTALSTHHNKPPLNTTSNSSDQESSDENEITEETNDILDSPGLIYSFNFLQIVTGQNFYLFQLNQTLQKCSKIALFVLHHSWKSYLI